jgi:PAS domain S-box-containing protein
MLGNPLDRPGQLRLVHAARRRSIDPTCLTGDLIYFPRKITNATLSTFRPAETTPRFTQEGFSAGFVDRLIVSGHAVLESTLAARTFEVDPKTQGELPMVSAPREKLLQSPGAQRPEPAVRRGPDRFEKRLVRVSASLSKHPARRFGTPTEQAEEVQKCQEVERKQAEDALRASEALYHSLVETIPMNGWRKDAAGRFTFANQGFCQTMGIPLDELIGKTDFDLSPTELAEGYRQADLRILTTGTIYEATEEVVAAEGQRRRIQIVKLRVRDGQGKIIGTQGIFWTTSPAS